MSLFLFQPVFSQSIVINSFVDETARSLQLLGKLDSSVSFSVRPLISGQLTQNNKIYSIINGNKNSEIGKPIHFASGKGSFQFLPLGITQQFNTHHPYGWNDGAMIAAKGYQSLLSSGFFTSLGPLEIQVLPELVYAVNPSFESNSSYGNAVPKTYVKFFPGQSSIRSSCRSLSIGISSESIWWGPGRFSSLLMSNNAPGFVHGFFSSKKPIQSPVGDFEWQLIGAKLTSDNSFAYENLNLQNASFRVDSRYLSAYVISYHPKWVPGLFLGMTRGLQRYKKDIQLSGNSVLNQYIPVLTKPFQKKNALGDDTLRTDQLASFFMRWVLPKAHIEFYIEYGYNDYNDNVRDYVMGPSHSAAHIVGVKKIVPLAEGRYLDFGFEMTQMSQSSDYIIRDAGNWYVHNKILQGYTNENQIMGSGAGLGCNVQTMTATWVNGWQKLGVLFERVERDPQYHLYKWVDLSIGILPQCKYKNIVLSGKFQFINSSQYAWEKDVNRFNLHSRLSVQYLF